MAFPVPRVSERHGQMDLWARPDHPDHLDPLEFLGRQEQLEESGARAFQGMMVCQVCLDSRERCLHCHCLLGGTTLSSSRPSVVTAPMVCRERRPILGPRWSTRHTALPGHLPSTTVRSVSRISANFPVQRRRGQTTDTMDTQELRGCLGCRVKLD